VSLCTSSRGLCPLSDALDAILLQCAAAAPEQWYSRRHAQQTGSDPERLLDQLELLWLEGLVHQSDGTAESGPGATLTPLGRQVAASPVLLERLRRGEPIHPDDPGAVVRNSLRTSTWPIATGALIAANVVVFAVGVSSAAGLLDALRERRTTAGVAWGALAVVCVACAAAGVVVGVVAMTQKGPMDAGSSVGGQA